jgi:hypothetical protein
MPSKNRAVFSVFFLLILHIFVIGDVQNKEYRGRREGQFFLPFHCPKPLRQIPEFVLIGVPIWFAARILITFSLEFFPSCLKRIQNFTLSARRLFT